MIDDGELDWKVIAINSDDALAADLNDISDVESKLPGVVSGRSPPYISQPTLIALEPIL